MLMRIVLISIFMNKNRNLNQPAAGFRGIVARIGGDKALRRKLMSLGIRAGQEVLVLHQRQNGVVILSNGNRVALGSGIAANILIEPMAVPPSRTRSEAPAA